MPLIILGAAILLLLVLILRFHLNAFLALVLTSFAVGAIHGMEGADIIRSITQGMGSTMGGLILILSFGTMLGRLIEESGAAHSITRKFVQWFGEDRIPLAMVLTGFLVGIPMIYNAGFLVLIPLVYTLSVSSKLPLMYVGIPLCAALSVTHGYLPPHPAPVTVGILYKANLNLTLFYGVLVAIPAIAIGGLFLGRILKRMDASPPAELFTYKEIDTQNLPSFALSFFVLVIPVGLMLLGAFSEILPGSFARGMAAIRFISDPNIALLIAVLAGVYFLGIRRNEPIKKLMTSMSTSLSSIALIFLIIAAGGAFKQVLIDTGTGEYIKNTVAGWEFSPLVLAWITAALLRLSLGSATVACITAAGILFPLIETGTVSPELMVLATGSGSLMFSHFNDVGFWMFKEYFNLSVKQTFLSWTVMETVVGLMGLAGVLLLDLWV